MLQDVLARVQEIDETFRKRGSEAWYRGHRRSEWQLKSTLHRHIERLTSNLGSSFSPEEKRDLLRDEEKTLYRRFKRDAWPLLGPVQRSDWGVVFTMQHYRLPTRLVDWTESFACALFFAQQHRQPGDAAAVWALDSNGLNEVSLNRRGLIALDEHVNEGVVNVRWWHPQWVTPPADLSTIAVSPIFTNPRMTAQRSAFTLAGDSFLPLEEQFDGRLVREDLLVKIELPAEGFDEVENYLRIAGLGAFTYFPDLEGLALDHEARVLSTLRDTQKFFYPDQTPDTGCGGGD
jgi:hypothetical protein